jgi:predicted O-methyltransferase YrrM
MCGGRSIESEKPPKVLRVGRLVAPHSDQSAFILEMSVPKKLKLSVAIAHFPYGGNGATSSEHPDLRHWEVETALKMRDDDRIESFTSRDFSDTPITMTRNRAMRKAKEAGIDLLLMVDSDQSPDKHRGDAWFKPFWDVAFNFLYENYHQGPRLIFAPYCGPPDETTGENVYVFQWATNGARGQETQFSLEPYTREQAAILTGIQEAAAGPTGMLLMDTRLLDLIQPSGLPKRHVLERLQSGEMTVDEALWALKDGYCHYEWTNSYAEEKASTEDVTLTRDISMAGIVKLGYNPVFCAWDSWIGHHKPWNVGKPRIYSADRVAETLRRAVLQGHRDNEVIVSMDRMYGGIGAEIEKAIKNQPRLEAPLCDVLKVTDDHKQNGHQTDVTLSDQRLTTGPWHAHGHAPAEQCASLADLVRSQAYAKDRGIRVMEIGSWLGTTAIAMADATKSGSVHCVDHWQGSIGDMTKELAAVAVQEDGADAVYGEFLRRIGDRFNKNIFPWRGASAERAAQEWQQFDIIFIDAEHTYEGLRQDILGWWKHLRDDGVMIGHDFETHGYAGVDQAVREIFGHGFKTFGWHPQGCMWMVEKKDHHGLEAAIEFGQFAEAVA